MLPFPRGLTAIAASLAMIPLMGCPEPEYGFDSPVEIVGAPNPVELETPIINDDIVQLPTPVVDILYIIDNSCSMFEEQTALTQAFPAFIDYFVGSGLDYHVGVISTDMQSGAHSGRLREVGGIRWLDDTTVAPEAVFTTMAAMGTTGSGDERGREAGFTAIELLSDDYNQGFVRTDASLHLISISDEEDHSRSNPISNPEWIDYLRTLKDQEDMVTASSIVNPNGCCSGFGDEAPGTKYMDVTREVGGIVWDIRTEDWTPMLAELGLQAAGLKREFFLSQLPVLGTIEVAVETDGNVLAFEETTQWTYEISRNSITFVEFIPPALSTIRLKYEQLADLQDEQIDEF